MLIIQKKLMSGKYIFLRKHIWLHLNSDKLDINAFINCYTHILCILFKGVTLCKLLTESKK
jgi:hypothetical protein